MEGRIFAKGGASYFPAVLIGALGAAIVLLLLSLAAAAAVYFSPLNETVLAHTALFLDGAACLSGGFLAARCSGRRGLIMGAAVGAILLLLMLALGGAAEADWVWKTGVCLLAACAGGVLGVR